MVGNDSVTGFLDRNGCLQLVVKLAAWAKSTGKPLAALWVDLDRFRQINESFGHLGGDQVILQMAERIRDRVHGRAELSRMGGDEFVCIAPGLNRHQVDELAHEIQRVIELPLHLGEMQLHPTASIGIAILENGEDPFAFIERTDRAMMEAKRQGGNRIVFSGDEPIPGRLGILLAREELAIENKLHTALESGGLRLHYQPILRADGSIEAIEALMRCAADDEEIPPARFIPVAEKTGLVIRLGEWSLLQGASHARRLQLAGLRCKVAINVSRAQLVDPKFSQALHGALICANVSPDLIELELTESLFMDISDDVQNNLRNARACGVGLAIDDFGTGYSCLANLKDIPATKLKLDRAFVKMLPQDQRALSVVRAMIQLGRELGMTVIAEGVETREQLETLWDAGVDAVQGYYHARPMDEEALQAWLAAREVP
ncbi:MAG: bifunctional diguanylate cyclase/phosphodiesterase [Proteobacteria bacterium]|nr:bifunctional diguanylate cyclase/phosphodiesterase [Pseudomonadota bacterium]HQR04749.1 bifunctional diguanylate cyclase/phosphodiesterase [Rhodocyclaceae bacterium]